MPKFTKDDLLEIIQRFSLDNLTELTLKTSEVSLELKKENRSNENLEEKIIDYTPEIKEDIKAEDEVKDIDYENYKVKSPMVGVFYEASEPGAKPFVTIGDKVKKGDTLYIIEAMKMIHEISSPISGEIKEIHIDDGEIVEYSQLVMEIIEC